MKHTLELLTGCAKKVRCDISDNSSTRSASSLTQLVERRSVYLLNLSQQVRYGAELAYTFFYEKLLDALVLSHARLCMERNPLLPLSDGMLIEQIQIMEAGLLIAVVATHPTSCCPLCSSLSSSIHSTYSRTLQDAPCAGRQIQLLLTMRKFFCRNPLCSRKIFTERLPQLVKPWACIRRGVARQPRQLSLDPRTIACLDVMQVNNSELFERLLQHYPPFVETWTKAGYPLSELSELVAPIGS